MATPNPEGVNKFKALLAEKLPKNAPTEPATTQAASVSARPAPAPVATSKPPPRKEKALKPPIAPGPGAPTPEPPKATSADILAFDPTVIYKNPEALKKAYSPALEKVEKKADDEKEQTLRVEKKERQARKAEIRALDLKEKLQREGLETESTVGMMTKVLESSANQKANQEFLARYADSYFKQKGGDDPDRYNGPDREALREDSRKKARFALFALRESGYWPFEIAEDSLKPDEQITWSDYWKALGPRAEVSASGESVRVEGNGMWALGLLGLPGAVAAEGMRGLLGDDPSMYRALREKGGFTEVVMSNPPVLEEWAKNDDPRAWAFLAGAPVLDVFFPDGTFVWGAATSVPRALTTSRRARAAARDAYQTGKSLQDAVEAARAVATGDALKVADEIEKTNEPLARILRDRANGVLDQSETVRAVRDTLGRTPSTLSPDDVQELRHHESARRGELEDAKAEHDALAAERKRIRDEIEAKARGGEQLPEGAMDAATAKVDEEIVVSRRKYERARDAWQTTKNAIDRASEYEGIYKKASDEALQSFDQPRAAKSAREALETPPPEPVRPPEVPAGERAAAFGDEAIGAKVAGSIATAEDVKKAFAAAVKGKSPKALEQMAKEILALAEADANLAPVLQKVRESVARSMLDGKLPGSREVEVVRRLLAVDQDALGRAVTRAGKRWNAARAKAEKARDTVATARATPEQRAALEAARADVEAKRAARDAARTTEAPPKGTPAPGAGGGDFAERPTSSGLAGWDELPIERPTSPGEALVAAAGEKTGAVPAHLAQTRAAAERTATVAKRTALPDGDGVREAAHQAIGIDAALEPLDAVREKQRADRFGPSARLHFAHAGEPYLRADYVQRPPMENAVRQKEHLLDLALEREMGVHLSNGKYLSGPEALDFATFFDLPHYPDYLPRGRFLTLKKKSATILWSALGEAHWKKLEEIAAGRNLPRARAMNEYLRSLLPWSDPLAKAEDVDLVRLRDSVYINDADLARQAGPIRQPVEKILDDAGKVKTRFEEVVTDGFTGEVVGFKDGKVLVQPQEFIDHTPRRRNRGPIVEVPVEKMEYLERGRVPRQRKGPKGGNIEWFGPMTRGEWEALRQAEEALPGARSARYANKERFVELAPPKRPAPDDFNYYLGDLDEPVDLAAAEARGVPVPRVEPPARNVAAASRTRAAAGGGDAAPAPGPGGAGAPPVDRPPVATPEEPPTEPGVPRSRDAARAAEDELRLAEEAYAGLRAAIPKEGEVPQRLRDRLTAREAALAEAERAATAAVDVEQAARGIQTALEQALGARRGERQDVAARLAVAEEAADARAARAAAPAPEDGVIPGRGDLAELTREQELVAEGLRRGKRGPVQATIENVGERLRNYFKLARDVEEASIKPALRVLMRDMDTRVGALDKALSDFLRTKKGSAFDTLGDDTLDSWANALDVADPGLLDLAATAFLNPNLRRVVENVPEDMETLRAALRTRGEGAFPELVDRLQQATQEVIRRHPDVAKGALRDPVLGDVILAKAIGTQALQHDSIKEMIGLGAAVGAEDGKAAAEWLAGTTRSDRGRAVVLQALSDPHNFVPSIKDLDAGEKGLRREQLNPLAAMPSTAAGRNRDLDAVALRAVAVLEGSPVYVPRAVRKKLISQIEAAEALAEPSAGGKMLLRWWKQGLTTGVVLSRPTYYLNNVYGDFDQIATVAGLGVAARQTARNLLQNVLAIPGVANGARLADAVRGADAGTSLRQVSDLLAWGAIGKDVGKVMDGENVVVRLGGKDYNARDLYRLAARAGIPETFATSELAKGLEEAVRSANPWGKVGRFFGENTGAVRDMADLISARQRFGLFLTLVDDGVEPAQAAERTVEALYDYRHSLHPIDRSVVVQLFHPFWSFEKNNALRTGKALLAPGAWTYGFSAPGYRIKVLMEGKEQATNAVTGLFDPRDEYGFDVDSMEQDDPEKAQQYKDVVDALRAEGLTPQQIRLGILRGGVPQLAGFGEYYNDDPVRAALPDHLYGKYVAMLPYSREAALRYWLLRGEGPKEAAGDDWRAVPMPEDSNVAGLALPFAALGVVINAGQMLAKSDPAAARRTTEAAQVFVGDPANNPLVIAVSKLLGYPVDAYDKEIPPGVGKVLNRWLGPRIVYAERTTSAGATEKESAQFSNTYKLTAGAAAWANLLGVVGPALTTAVATEHLVGSRAAGKGPGDLVATLAEGAIGQRTYSVSRRAQEARSDKRSTGAVYDATQDVDPESALLNPLPPDVQRRDARELERERLGGLKQEGTYDGRLEDVFLRYYRRKPEDGDIATFRALAVDFGMTPERVDSMDDVDVQALVPLLGKYYVPRMSEQLDSGGQLR